ncbi:MAG: hypothetical protein JNM93_02815 [Bacteriovoracaceae bacterium]|nr:hypothetical protein [Bacteriovoracaceae bacterium]
MSKKFIVFFLFFLLSAQSLLAQTNKDSGYMDKIIRYISENSALRGYGLYKVLDIRCQRYAAHFMDRTLCPFSLMDLVQVLDFDIVFEPEKTVVNIEDRKYTDEYERRFNKAEKPAESASAPLPRYVFSAFKTKLLELLENPQTHDYLKVLNQKFYRYSQNIDKDFDLWTATLTHFKGDRLSALTHIAVLLQDTTHLKLHIEYVRTVKKTISTQMEKNLTILSSLIDNMNFLAEMDMPKYVKALYPPTENKNRNLSAYHFYVPAYLAKRLQNRGYTKRLSAVTAFMLPLTYELVSAEEGLTNILWDPKKIENNDWKLQDIMQGHGGALFGINYDNKLKDTAKVKKYFAVATFFGAYYLTDL